MVKYILPFLFCLSINAAQPWSIVQSGDFHCGTDATSNDIVALQAFMLTHTNDGVFNAKIHVSPGDIYEQASPMSPVFTNLLDAWTLEKAGGIMVLPENGNHDADETNTITTSSGSRFCDPGTDWNVYFPTNFFTNYAGYKGTKDVGDTKHVAVTYTNGFKFLFLTIPWATNLFGPPYDIRAAYQASVNWCSNMAQQYPDHKVIIQTHYMLNVQSNYSSAWDTGLTLYSNIGPAEMFWNCGGLNISNLFLVLSGHTRTSLKQHRFFYNLNGDVGCVVQWNTQNYATNSAQMFSLITFVPDTGTVLFRSYDIARGAWLTNGETHFSVSTPGQFTHNWSIPMPGAIPFVRTLEQ